VQTSGKSQRQVAEDLGGSDEHAQSLVLGDDSERRSSFCRQWKSPTRSRRDAPPPPRKGYPASGSRYLQKSACHLLASVEDRYHFIEHHHKQFEVRIMCRVLEVSVSGFSAWKKRPMSSRKREDGVLTEQIVEIFQIHRGVHVFTRSCKIKACTVDANGSCS
jgi:hypothetical protein